MFRLTVIAAALSVVLSISFVLLNRECPMVVDGPSSVIGKSLSEIENLGLAVTMYRLENKRYPSSLEDLVQANNIYRVPTDCYGTPYRYTVTKNGSGFEIYSMGANRTDESGRGDDIVSAGKKYSCPLYYRCPTSCERFNSAAFFGGALSWLATIILAIIWLIRSALRAIRRPTDSNS